MTSGMTLAEVAGRLACSYRHVRRLVKLYVDSDGIDGLEAIPVAVGQRKLYCVTEEQLQRFILTRLNRNLGARGRS